MICGLPQIHLWYDFENVVPISKEDTDIDVSSGTYMVVVWMVPRCLASVKRMIAAISTWNSFT